MKTAKTATTAKPKTYVEPPRKPVVFVSVLPKADIAGNYSDSSPKVFATREAAQLDCDNLNKSRNPRSRFVVREMEIN
jgi:hypothetical protein